MARCNTLFKIFIIILTLVSSGTGFTKFYQLVVNLGDTVVDIGDADSFKDLEWLPYLVVQVCATCFTFVQIYCLVRELYEDNYMYNHCFKFCFILTVLIYCISVLPKSIMDIIYHDFGVTVKEWRTQFAGMFDSLLAGLTALGYQVILYMKLIRRILRSAEACRGTRVSPNTSAGEDEDSFSNTDVNMQDTDTEVPESGCCHVCCCSTKGKARQHNGKDRASLDQTAANKVHGMCETLGVTKAIAVQSKVSNLIKSKHVKVKEYVREKRNTITRKAATAVINETDEQKSKKYSKRSENHESSFTKNCKTEIKERNMRLCENCLSKVNNNVELEDETNFGNTTNLESPTNDIAHIKTDKNKHNENMKRRNEILQRNEANGSHIEIETLQKCVECGQSLCNNIDKEQDCQERQNCCFAGCLKSKTAICSCLDNRMRCFIITIVLANLHMVVFFVELFFIFCAIC